MPLTVCLDCSREVSPKARLCVHCGRPWPSRKCGVARKLLTVLLIAGLAFGGVAAVKHQAQLVKLQKTILHKIQDMQVKVSPQPPKAENFLPSDRK